MSEKSDIKDVEDLFQEFLVKSLPYLTGKNSKAVLKALNAHFQHVADGKAKKLVKRVEKEFGVSLEDQFKQIEMSEKGRWKGRVGG